VYRRLAGEPCRRQDAALGELTGNALGNPQVAFVGGMERVLEDHRFTRAGEQIAQLDALVAMLGSEDRIHLGCAALPARRLITKEDHARTPRWPERRDPVEIRPRDAPGVVERRLRGALVAPRPALRLWLDELECARAGPGREPDAQHPHEPELGNETLPGAVP